jgi:membrane protein
MGASIGEPTETPWMQTRKKTTLLDVVTHIWDPKWLRRWAEPYHKQKGWRAFGVRQLEVFVLTARSVYQEEITLRAAALTYNTLLSLVPLLAVGFALFKAFGGLRKLEGPLRQLVVENLAVGRGEEVGLWLDQFIEKVNAGAIAGVGVLVLFYSAVALLTNIEGSFNRIWGIQRGRSLVVRFFTYWGLITLAPPLVGFSVSLTAQLQSSSFATAVVSWMPWGIGKLLISLLSALSTCMAFVFSYIIVPNTKVRIRAALLGGIVAGLLWNLSKYAFITATAGTIKYSAVYGALGVLPLLMIWMYISWLIVLFGCTYTYANQSVHTEGLELAAVRMSQSFRELLAARLVVAVSRSFMAGEPAPTADELAERAGAMTSLAQRVLSTLVDHNILAEAQSGGEDPGYLPGRSIQDLSLEHVVEALRSKDGETFALKHDAVYGEVARALEQAEQAAREALGQHSLRSLAEKTAAAQRQGEGSAE